MIGSMRANKTNKTVVWVILGLLALGLIGFGGVGSGGGAIRSIGQVGEEKISTDAYAQAMNRALSNLSQQFGRTITATEAQAYGIQNTVLQSLLTTAALDDETTKLGLSIGDEAVRSQLLADRAFQGLDGSFNKEAYSFTLERAGMTAAQYDTILRKQAARVFLQSAVVTGIKSQGTQTRALLAFNRETRDFTWAALTSLALTEPIAPPMDTQIQSQYEAAPDAYTAPLTFDITYVWLNPADLGERVNLDETDIRESYDLQSDRFNKPEKRSLERIVFATMEEATTARNLLDAGSATFDTLLADRRLTPADVDLGEVERGGISTAAAEVVFTATGPGIVGPVTSSLGPALFRINAVLAEDITPYEDARAEIVAELAGEAARRLVSDMVTDIEDMLAAGDTLEILAKDTDMVLGKISFTPETTEGIAAYENFRTVAARTKQGDFPEINDLADGGIFALRLDAVKQPALRPMAEVKDQVIADWAKAETLRRLTTKAETLKSDIEAGASFGSLATHTETAVNRTGFIENTPPALISGMFALKVGQASVVAGPDGVFIARLDHINAFDEGMADSQIMIDAIQQQIDAQIGNDLLTTFAAALRDRAGISLNQPAINQINAQLTGG